jgi:transcriptional regulator with XRE-family HTH domain
MVGVGGNLTSARVQERMDTLGLDQSELARRVGCSPAAINQIVTGKTQNSRFLPKIARSLGVSLSYLEGETADPADLNIRQR